MTIPNATGTVALLQVANIFTAIRTINLNAVALPAPPGADTVLQIGNADGTGTRLLLDAFATQNIMTFRRANTTAAAPSALAANDVMGSFTGAGYFSGGVPGYTGSGLASISTQPKHGQISHREPILHFLQRPRGLLLQRWR